MIKIPFPFQRSLFEKITEQHHDYATAVAHYQKKYNCSRSKAYAIFKGERAIDGDHFMALMSEYNLHNIDVWPGGWPDTNFVVTVPSIRPDLDTYLNMLHGDLTALSKQSNPYIYHSTNDLPLILLKTRRPLAGFLLFYFFNFEQPMQRYKGMKFGSLFLKDTNISNWLDRCREVLHTYHEIPGTEYWSPRMLDALIVKINFVHSIDGFECKEDYHHLFKELSLLVQEMENMAERGTKLKGAKVQIYNSQGIIRSDIMIGMADNLSFLYQDCGLLDLHRYQNSNVIGTRLSQINNINNVAPSLSNNIKSRRDFFIELKQSIEKK